MPELPDIEAYLHALRLRVKGHRLERISVVNPFLLRSVEPPVDACEGREVVGLRRVGKRVAIELRDEPESLFLVIHLMVAGRFQWREIGAKAPARITQAVFRFDCGELVLTEAGTQRRASLMVVRGEGGVRACDPGGLEVLDEAVGELDFLGVLTRENRTLKRALTDPRTISGIGNAYSDEILHAARLSPILLTGKITREQAGALLEAARRVLRAWTERLCGEFEGKFPGGGDVTAFRPEFAAHGKFGRPCPVCGVAIQRIVRAENEINYCPGCQTGGRILADRSLSRLLREDWPRSVEELG